MNLSFITKRFGFDSAVVRELPDKTQWRLAVESILTLVSCILYGLSAGYLAYIESYEQQFAVLIAIFVGIAVFLFMLNIQRLFITSGGFGLSRRIELLNKWRPDQLRLFCTFLLAVLFSQPLLLLIMSGSLKEKVDQQITEQVASFKQAEIDHIEGKRGPLIVRLQGNLDKMKRSGVDVASLKIDVPPAVVHPQAAVPDEAKKPATAPAVHNRRQALVIGVQKYSFAESLMNPVKDANDMDAALRRMGYQVTLVKDPHGTSKDLTLAVHKYLKSLQPGDISIFYFSGHGFSEEGNNYLAASDTPKEIPLSLTSIIEEIGKTSPRANILLIDACSSRWNEAKKGGLAGFNTDIKNTYVVLAASPGQSAIDQAPNTNSLFTEAVRRHIEKPQGIDDIFAQVRQDVIKKAEFYKQPQTPLVMNTLAEVGFRLSDKEGKPGRSASSSAAQGGTQKPSHSVSSDPARQVTAIPEDPCRTGNGYDSACLLADTELIRSRLASLDKESGSYLEKIVSEQEQFLKVSGHLEDRFRLQWSDALKSFVISALLTFLLWMGDLMRDANPIALREYERVRYGQSRKILRNAHVKAAHFTERALAKYPSYQTDTRERIPIWNFNKDFFFEEEIRRPDHRDVYADLVPESVNNLIDDMRQAGEIRTT